MKRSSLAQPLLTALFAVAAVCYWGIAYPHHLHFQEQAQLFAFGGGYAREVMAVPGGVADYVGRFLTQFFLFAWVGAVLTALLLTAVHLLVARRQAPAWRHALSFVPALLLWCQLLDENSLPGLVVAVLLTLLAAGGIRRVPHHGARCAVALVALPVAYWVAGPVALWLWLGVALDLVTDRRRSAMTYVTVAAGVLLALALPTVARHCVAVDQARLTWGVHYLRTASGSASLLWWAVAATLGIRALDGAGQRIRLAARGGVLLTVAVWALGGALIHTCANPAAEEVMAYDYMARHQQWNRILQRADRRAPRNPICATAVNLALAMKGRMAEHLLDYPQRGTAGLLPAFDRDPLSPLVTGEVFYHLGMINTAQRFTFEAQEALPDYQKSARCYKRLAETNLINGAYDVARKYLLTLQRTWYYRSWATETLALLGDEPAIRRHREYGRLRQLRIEGDFYYSDRDLPQMLGQLYMANQQNQLAYDYLQATNLLTGDMDLFVQCLDLRPADRAMPLPTLYQQAVMLWWSRDHRATDAMPTGVRQDVTDGIRAFFGDMQRYASQPERMGRYARTYWYYYFFDRPQ